jgi:uncharacterized membrane protein YqjE
MSNRSAKGLGLFDRLKRVLDSLLQLAQLRLELLGTELEAEKLRLFDALLKAAVGLMLLGLAAVLALAFVVLLLWDGYRLAATGVLALVFGGLGAWFLGQARHQLRSKDGGPFALTLAELRRDRVDLQPSAPAAPPP